jgi:hypothetical protein
MEKIRITRAKSVFSKEMRKIHAAKRTIRKKYGGKLIFPSRKSPSAIT